MTTGIAPDGAGRALSLVIAWRAASRASLLDVDRVEDLESDRVAHRLVPGLHAGVAVGDGADAQQGAHHFVVGEHAVGVGDQHRLRLSP